MAKRKSPKHHPHHLALKAAAEAVQVLGYFRDKAKKLKPTEYIILDRERALWWFNESARKAKQVENYLQRTKGVGRG